MVQVVPISPQNEIRVAERLATEIRRLWPGVEGHRGDRVDLLAGVRCETDVDLLVAVDLERPRRFRDTADSWIHHALIAIEIKQLDPERYTRSGNQLFPNYRDGLQRRSVGHQARVASTGVKNFAPSSGFRPGSFTPGGRRTGSPTCRDIAQ